MLFRSPRFRAVVALAIVSTSLAHAQATASLTPIEQRMAGSVDANNTADVALLEQLVDIHSGAMHLAGGVAIEHILVPKFEKLQQSISFPTEDGGHVCADLYGRGTRAVVLAHGGRFNKESWREQAEVLTANGFRVLAIDFRGFGCSTGPDQADFDHAPFAKDVLAAVRYLKADGARTVSVVGGSFGGGAAGDASIESPPGTIDRIVFLGAAPNLSAEKLKSRALFIVAREDANDSGLRLPGIRKQYERAPQPKELLVLDGSAHAQFLFQTDQNARVMREIVRFLTMP